MEEKKQRLHELDHRLVPMNHTVSKLYSEAGGQPVRLSADRVPTFTLLSNDQTQPSKVVLNKHGWNPQLKFHADLVQKTNASSGEASRPRSILRESNDNLLANQTHLRISSQPSDSSKPYNIYDVNKDTHGLNQHSAISNGHNSEAGDSRFCVTSNESNRNSRDISEHTRASEVPKGVVLKNGSSNQNLVPKKDSVVNFGKIDDSGVNFQSTNDRPIFSVNSFEQMCGGDYLNACVQGLSNCPHEKYAAEGCFRDNAEIFKRTRLGFKVQQHKDQKVQDGLERVRQLVARQRGGNRNHGITDKQDSEHLKRKQISHTADIPHDATVGLFPHSLAAGSAEKNVDDIAGFVANGHAVRDAYLPKGGKSLLTHTLHRSDDVVQLSKRTKYEQKVASIPRKVTQAPAPPSYKGFCEVGSMKTVATDNGLQSTDGTTRRGAEPRVAEPAASQREVTDKTEGQTLKMQDSKRKKIAPLPKDVTEKHISQQTVSPAKSSHNVEPPVQKKLSKPNKTDINVRSWRAGVRVVEQQLGKLPKMSHSPPTKDSSPEQNLDDFSPSDLPSAQSKIPGRSFTKHDEFSKQNNAEDDDFEKKGCQSRKGICEEERDILGDYGFEEKNFNGRLEPEKDTMYEQLNGNTVDGRNEDSTEHDNGSISNDEFAPEKLTAKIKSGSLQQRKGNIAEREKEREQKMQRDRSYDKEEVKRFMAKQKAERKKKEKEEQEEKIRAEENRQRQLEELSRKQKKSAKSKSHPPGKVRQGKASRDNSTDGGGGSHQFGSTSSAEVSSVDDMSYDKVKNLDLATDKRNQAGRKRDAREIECHSDHSASQGKEMKATNRNSNELAYLNIGLNGTQTKNKLAKTDGSYQVAYKSDGNRSTAKENDSKDASVASKEPVDQRNPSAKSTSSTGKDTHSSVEINPARSRHAERLAALEKTARSLSSRLNVEAKSFANVLSSKDIQFPKPELLYLDASHANSLDDAPPVRNAWMPPASAAAGLVAKNILTMPYSGPTNNDEKNEDSDSTLTEESATVPEKILGNHLMENGTSMHLTKVKPYQSNQEEAGSSLKNESKRSNIEKWITQRVQKDSDAESTITGSVGSDTESEGKASTNDSAALPVHWNKSSVGGDAHTEFVLKLQTLQQNHRANMLSLQAKSRQDLILASRRPLSRNESSASQWIGMQKPDKTATEIDKMTLGTKTLTVAKLPVVPQSRSINLGDKTKSSTSSRSVPEGLKTSSYRQVTKNFVKNPAETGLDYSMDLDASLTEEEMERSMRDILPSEKHCKKLRRNGSLTNLVPSADQSSAKHIFDSESFDAFSLNMVRNYLTQEQSRMHHQHMLLKLREKALTDKTRTQLAWLEQQKLTRRKGSDDSYPLIREKQKEILEKHKKEETSIHILQNLAKQALSMQHGSLSDLESIQFMQKTAQKIKQELDRQNPKIKKWLDTSSLTPRMLSSDSESMASARSDAEQLSEGLKEVDVGFDDSMIPYNEMPNEDQPSIEYATTDTSRSQSPQRDLAASNDGSLLQSESPTQEKIAQRLRMQLDTRYLTLREKKLRQRRLEAERLLAWKNRLDEEEEEVVQLEMKAAQKIPHLKGTAVGSDSKIVDKSDTRGSKDPGVVLSQYKDCSTSPIHSTPTLSTKTLESGRSEGELPVVVTSAVRSDIILSQLKGVTPHAKENPIQNVGKGISVSADATAVGNDSSEMNRLALDPEELRTSDLSEKQRGSTSETDDSISVLVSETTTDQSELERHTKALKDELRRKRIEVENLRKKKKKQEMKAKESSLRKQIELANEEIRKLSEVSLNFSETSSPILPPTKHSVPEIQRTNEEIRKLSQGSTNVSESSSPNFPPTKRSVPEIQRTNEDIRKLSQGSTNVSEPSSLVLLPWERSESEKSPVKLSGAKSIPADEGSDRSSALCVEDFGKPHEVSPNSDQVFPQLDPNIIVTVPVHERQDEGKEYDSLEKNSHSPDDNLPKENIPEDSRDVEEVKPAQNEKPIKHSDDMLNNESPPFISSVGMTTYNEGKTGSGNEEFDDFFDTKMNFTELSYNVFKVGSNLKSDKQEEPDSDKSEKSVSSKKSHPSHSVKSKSEVSMQSDHKIERTISEASEKSSRSVSPLISGKSDKVKKGISGEGLVLDNRRAEGESLLLKQNTGSDFSSDSKDIQPSFTDKFSAAAPKTLDDNIGKKDLEERNHLVDQETVEDKDENSDVSVRSAKKSLSSKASDVSKISQSSRTTTPSTSSATRSYTEDFSSTSKRTLKKDAPNDAPTEEEHSIHDSEAEEVKTEDDLSSSLSEDFDAEDALKSSEAKPDLEAKLVSAAETNSPQKLSVEDVGELSRNSHSSDDNLLKENIPEILSEADILNDLADQTLPSAGESRLDADERSFSGAGDSELERVISSAAAAVEEFEKHPSAHLSTVAGLEPVNSLSTTDVKDRGVDAIMNNTMQSLISGAVAEVLEIKAKKESSPEKAEHEIKSSIISDQPTHVKTPEPDSHQQVTPPSLAPFDNDWWDGEYLDDDFGWPTAQNKPPPPPYEEISSDDLRTQVQQMVRIPEASVRVPDVAMVVPHTQEEILLLSDQAVDFFWHLRRCGELWEGAQPNEEYFGADGDAITPESSSRRMYKLLIFDVVSEFLQDMYRDEENVENAKFLALIPPHPAKWQQYYKEREPPTTVDVLKPVVRSHVMRIVGQQVALQKVPRKWSTRRKDDGVDRVLIKELHEEEPEWISYEEDTVKIKLQLTDAIFQLLLTDTVHTLMDINRRIETNKLPEF